MGITAQEIQSLKIHTSDITSCDFSSSCLLVTGSGDKSVRVWSWKTGLGYVEEDYSPLKAHKYGVTCVTFSPQGTMLASASIDGNTILWSARNGSKIHGFSQVNGDAVRVCRFNKDSCTLVTAGDNGVVCVWDLVQRTLIRVIQHHEEAVNCLAFTPDSSFLLTTCNHGVIKLYHYIDICDTTQTDIAPLVSVDDAHDLGVLSCDFSNAIEPDEDDPLGAVYSLVTSGNDQCLRLWRVRGCTGGKLQGCRGQLAQVTNNAHSSGITCVRFNYDGDMICSSSLDKTIKIWDKEGNCLLTIDAHSRYINCVCFSRNGKILCSGSNDKSVKIWDLTGEFNVDSEIKKPCSLLSHFGCGDLKGISMIQEEDIVLFKGDHENNEVILHQNMETLHTAAINSLEFGPDGLLVTGSGDKTVRLLKADKENEMYHEYGLSLPFATHRYQVNCVTFISSSLLASCSLDGNISLRPFKEQSFTPSILMMSRHLAGVRCMKAVGNVLLAAYDDGSATIWKLDPPSAAPIVVYPEHANAATCCSLSPDGRLAVTASHNGDFRIFTLPDIGEPYNTEAVFTMDCAHDLGVQSMDFALVPEELPLQILEDTKCHLLATCGNDCLAKIWKITLSKEYQRDTSPKVHLEQRPFWLMPNQSEKTDSPKLCCVEWRIFAGHGSSVTCVRFPHNRSDLMCTASADKQARIWSVYAGQCLHVLEHGTLVVSCSFSPRGTLLATGCISGELCLWKLPRHLVFESDPSQLILASTKDLLEWTSEDLVEWIKDTCQVTDADNNDVSHLVRVILVKVLSQGIRGRDLIAASEEDIPELLDIDSENASAQNLLQEISWIRMSSPLSSCTKKTSKDPPHHMLCPITHCLMMQPVKCADGFTYEKRAINEWFLSGGKYVSPMTNQPLLNNIVTPNRELKKEIMKFLYEDE